MDEHGEAHTLGLLKDLRTLAEEISHGHMDYAHRFHELLRSVANPNLSDIAKEMQYGVTAYEAGTRQIKRTIALSANPEVARAAFECACKLFPKDRWLLTWGGYVMTESERLPVNE